MSSAKSAVLFFYCENFEIPIQLASVGYVLVQARGNETPPEFPDDVIEKLSIMEHKRWMDTHISAGWKYAKITDKSKKLHKCLVDWEQLSGEDKEKDRVLVRQIPEIIKTAGYTVMKVS